MKLESELSAIEQAMNTLNDIESKIKNALADKDDYMTWAGFFQDKMGELMPIKDEGKEAVDQLKESVNNIREKVGDQYEDYFSVIDEKKENLKNTVDEIKDTASLTTVALNGEELIELLEKLLTEFGEISTSVENLVEEIKQQQTQ